MGPVLFIGRLETRDPVQRLRVTNEHRYSTQRIFTCAYIYIYIGVFILSGLRRVE